MILSIRNIIIGIGILFSISNVAQDIHFSQFDLSPVNLNPALTGQFVGDYRFVGNYRTQWSSITVPYNTLSFGADASNLLPQKNYTAGIQINQDVAGDSRFKTFQANVSAAYLMPITADSAQNLSFGLQTGVTNKNLDYDPLYFDVQYDGYAYNPSLSNQENFVKSSKTYINLNTGIAYFNQIEKRKTIGAGIALFNINKPDQSFYNEAAIKLDRRLVIHTNAEWMVSDKINVLPSLLYMRQGKYSEFNFGGAAKYILTDFIGMYRTVWMGMYYRNKDAGFITAGMDYDNWKVGISYDINTSSLVPASRRRGGLELAVIYIINKTPFKRVQHRVCPDYI